MKKQYIVPSVIVAEYQGNEMIALSPNGAKISTNSAGNPYGENLDKVSGDDGNAWGGAAVKSYDMWDE